MVKPLFYVGGLTDTGTQSSVMEYRFESREIRSRTDLGSYISIQDIFKIPECLLYYAIEVHLIETGGGIFIKIIRNLYCYFYLYSIN